MIRILNKFLSLFQPALLVEHFAVTDVGNSRENNEDNYFISEEKKLFIVADGMGGHNAGEVASQQSTDLLNAYFTDDLLTQMVNDGVKRIQAEMLKGLQSVSTEIYKQAQTAEHQKGMGCAIVFALLFNDTIHIGHVGDCRAYLLREDHLTCLTVDHTVVMDFFKAGEMTLEEVHKSPLKNQLTQAIGSGSQLTPGYTELLLRKRDRLLFCSDGLWDMVPDEDIKRIISQKNTLEDLTEQLVTAANIAGGEDNITVLLLSAQ